MNYFRELSKRTNPNIRNHRSSTVSIPVITHSLENYIVAQHELKPGERYTFYRKNPYTRCKTAIFRASLVQLYQYEMNHCDDEPMNSINVNCIHYMENAHTTISIPFDWLFQIINLITILQNKSPFPDEILRIIDSYL